MFCNENNTLFGCPPQQNFAAKGFPFATACESGFRGISPTGNALIFQ
jgi:hypothetical protein